MRAINGKSAVAKNIYIETWISEKILIPQCNHSQIRRAVLWFHNRDAILISYSSHWAKYPFWYWYKTAFVLWQQKWDKLGSIPIATDSLYILIQHGNQHWIQLRPIGGLIWGSLYANMVTDLLTNWGLKTMVAILQMIFSNAFCWIKIIIFWLKFQWALFLSTRLTSSHHCFW